MSPHVQSAEWALAVANHRAAETMREHRRQQLARQIEDQHAQARIERRAPFTVAGWDAGAA